MSKTNAQLAQETWRNLSGEERHQFRAGSIGGTSARTYIVEHFGERFNTTDWKDNGSTAWSELVKLSDAWANGEEDDGSNEAPS